VAQVARSLRSRDHKKTEDGLVRVSMRSFPRKLKRTGAEARLLRLPFDTQKGTAPSLGQDSTNMAFQLELRSRTEGQTSYNLVSGNDRTYELTRTRGSMEYRPTAP
jgi:hypothetical protein